MQFTSTFAGLVAVSAATVGATTFKVAVGQNGLTYTPNNLTAVVGDKIEFDFFPKNHTVTQSSFADPCHPLAAGGFFSGFQPTSIIPTGTTFTITVNDTKPIWFYCSQPAPVLPAAPNGHCQAGMVGAINAPLTGNTLAKFTSLAANASASTAPTGGPIGGVLVLGAKANSTSNSTSSSTSLTTSSTAKATATTGAGSSSTTSPAAGFTGAASSVSGNMFGLAAVVIGAVAMI